jgi:DNA-binding transcriptional LysR family regulator
VLAARAEEILGRLDAAEEELAAHAGLRAGRVRLAAFPSALGTFVPRAATRFVRAHPEVELRFVEAEPPEAVTLLKTGEVDVALLFDYAADGTEDLRRVPLLREPLHLVARDGGTLRDFRDAPWIAGCERCRTQLVRLCAEAGFTPRIAYTTDDYVAVQSLVAAGLGVTVLPELAISAHRHPDVRAEAIPGAERSIVAAVYGDPPDPPATAALLRALTEVTTPGS